VFYKVFKSNQIVVFAFIVLLCLVFSIPLYFIGGNNYYSSSGLLETFLTDIISQNYGLTINIIIIILSTYLVKRISSEHSFVKESTHLSSLFYLGISLLMLKQNFSLEILSSLFLILAWQYILRIYNQQYVYNLSFNAGFLLAISCIFFNYNLPLLLLPMIALLILRTPKFKEFLMVVVGAVIPFIYYVVILYFFDSLYLLNDYFSFSNFSSFTYKYAIYLTVLMVIISNSVIFFRYLSTDTIRKRNLYLVLIIMLFLSISSLVVTKSISQIICQTLFPLTLIYTRMIVDIKKMWVKEVLTTSFVVACVVACLVENGLINF